MANIVRIRPARSTASPFFKPWLGENYRRGREAFVAGEASCCDGRWHIMGESHYGNPHEHQPSLTQDVIRGLAFEGYPFFDTVLSVALNKSVSDLDRVTEWNGLAFSNFVQGTLPPSDRRPHDKHWQTARDAFFGQLAFTRPKQLLVVGKMCWRELPTEGYTSLGSVASAFTPGLTHDAGLYAYEVGDSVAFTLVTWIYHPSSRGLLDVELAQDRVRTVTAISCNVLSEL